MRIAVLTSEFPSVSETFVVHHVSDLVARGHEVDVFPERSTGWAACEPELLRFERRVRHHLPPPMPERRAARVWRAARLTFRHRAGESASLLRSLNPVAYGREGASLALLYRQLPFLRGRPYDIVHCHHGPTGRIAAQLRRLGVLRGRLVVSFHGHDVNVAPRRRGRNLYTTLFDRADLLLANSEFLCGRLLELGAPPARLLRQPVGVDPSDFLPGARPAAAPEGVRLLSVARLVEAKGIDVALRAIARLHREHPRLHYTIVGDGPQRAELEQLAAALGVAAQVTFTGAQPHDRVRAAMAAAHVFCLPSVIGSDGAEEAQGLALVEAQACGLPVVASAIGGVPESMRDGVTGLLVPPGDPEALAGALRPLLSGPERRRALGQAGRAFAAEHFDRGAWTDRLLDRYERILCRPPRPLGVSSHRARAGQASGI